MKLHYYIFESTKRLSKKNAKYLVNDYSDNLYGKSLQPKDIVDCF